MQRNAESNAASHAALMEKFGYFTAAIKKPLNLAQPGSIDRIGGVAL
jgi:hypothetical protein